MVRSMVHVAFLVAALWGNTFAADLYVNNVAGDDGADGRRAEAAFRTIAKAVEMVTPGDTIHLTPTGTVYRESLLFHDKGGTPEARITVDGHGAWLTGADPCDAAGWQAYAAGEAGTVMRSDLVAGGPWFSLCVDGEMTWGVRNIDILAPGEFAYVRQGKTHTVYLNPPGDVKTLAIEAELKDGTRVPLDPKLWSASHSRNRKVRRHRGLTAAPVAFHLGGDRKGLTTAPERLAPGEWCRQGKTIYYRPPAGKTVEEVKILAVPRSSAVGLLGRCGYITIKNLNVVYTANDGYNIHGAVKDARFYNCNAFYCFDEGFSSHDTCETLLDGAVYINCDNGIANVNKCLSVTRNVICANARSVGLLLKASGGGRPQVVENLILVDNPSQFNATETQAENLLIIKTAAAKRASALSLGAATSVARATVLGNTGLLRVNAGSQGTLASSLIAPGQGTVHARTDDPAAALTVRDCLFASGTVLEWGRKYPWKTRPLGEWLAEAGTGSSVQEVTWHEALLAGKPPAALPQEKGCTLELIQRYLDFLEEREALLAQAKRMAWGE